MVTFAKKMQVGGFYYKKDFLVKQVWHILFLLGSYFYSVIGHQGELINVSANRNFPPGFFEEPVFICRMSLYFDFGSFHFFYF